MSCGSRGEPHITYKKIAARAGAALSGALDRIDKDGSLTPVSRYVMRASVYFGHNLLADAVAETEKALGLAPGDETLESILARLYSEVGRSSEAMAIYDRILDKQ